MLKRTSSDPDAGLPSPSMVDRGRVKSRLARLSNPGLLSHRLLATTDDAPIPVGKCIELAIVMLAVESNVEIQCWY